MANARDRERMAHVRNAVLTLAVAPFIFLAMAAGAESDDWPQFRGPGGQGHSSAKNLPVTWSEKDHIKWKTPVPGLGWSSPAIRDGQIWLTTAVDKGHVLKALCIDQKTGGVIHDVTVFAGNTPTQLCPPNSHASPSSIIDGDRVFVHFGQYGTACLGTNGKILWTAKLAHQTMYGPSSTPVVAGDLLIVPCYGTDVRYLVALDKTTGKERWKKPQAGRNAESTPLVIQAGEGDKVVTTLDNRTAAYDAKTGREIWSATLDWGYALVPRPVIGHGLIFLAGGYFNPTLYAYRLGGKGDISKSHLVWRTRKGVPHNPSPVLVGDELYMVSDIGAASCLDAKTGKLHWSERLNGGFYASPLYADGRIYFSSQEGVTTVVAPGTMFRKLATNRIEGQTLACLAVSGRSIYLRSHSHLYRIENP